MTSPTSSLGRKPQETPLDSILTNGVRSLCDMTLVAGALSAGGIILFQIINFPIEIDPADLTGEVLMGLAALTGYFFVRRLGVSAMTIGWTLLVLGFTIDVTDEFKTGYRPFEISQPILLIGGFLVTAFGLYRSQLALRQQLTRARRAEAEAAANEERFKDLFEDAPVGYWEVDLVGTVRRANTAAHQLLGFPSGDLRGSQLDDLLVHGRTGDLDPTTVEAGARGREVELEFLRKDGESRIVLVHQNIIRGSDGAINGSRMALMDITHQQLLEREQERLQKQLHHSQRLETIGTLAGGIAHDFNNLLVPIMGNLELALDEIPPENYIHKDLAEAQAAASRARELVRQILTFSKKGDRRLKPMSVQDVVKEVSGLLRPSLPSTIEITTHSDAGTPLVDGDQGQLHQVLMNLSANASHAMAETGGRLTFDLKTTRVTEARHSPTGDLAPGTYAHISISDTGMGMDSTTLEKIFDPFFTTKGMNGGTGLGLSVVHGIISGFGGSIIAESVEGEGSTFHIFLPESTQGASSAPPTEEGQPSREPVKGEGRILLVDDEPSVLSLTERMLARGGYEVVSHLESPKALQDLESHPDSYQLIVTDHTMPRMTGIDLALAAKGISPTTPILLMSGNDSSIPPGSADAAGVSEVLEKPVPYQDLMNAVQRVMHAPV